MNDFESYWKNFGRYHTEVLEYPHEDEARLKSLCFKIYKETCSFLTKQSDNAYKEGYADGKMDEEQD